MKKYILSFAVLGFCLFLSCRSKDVIPITADFTDTLLLKTLSVKGVSDVKIDHVKGIIQVTLPESYSSEFIDLDFTLQKGGFLNLYDGQKAIPNVNTPENLTYRFTYEGFHPLNINVQKLFGFNSKDYVIYVNRINGKLQASLGRVDSVQYNFVTDFYLDIISSIGTIPNKPDAKTFYVLLRKVGSLNADTISVYGSNNKFSGGFNLSKYTPFENDLFKIELVYNGEVIVVKENFKFIRRKSAIEVSYAGLLASINKNFELKGGIFVASSKYAIKLSNDYMNGSIELKAHVKDGNTLIIENNSVVKLGGYLVDVYENDVVLYHGVINVGDGGLTSAIRNFIKYNNFPLGIMPPAAASTKKEQLMAGDSLLILPVDAVFFGNSRPISAEELDTKIAPKLKLTMLSKEIFLNPTKKVYGWAIAGASVLYFQYTLPKSTESGFYEAQLVYPDGRESLKYWNKIEIK